MPTDTLLPELRARVEQVLDRVLPISTKPPQHLHEAMRYAALAKGKRIRAMLVYATGRACGAADADLDTAAAAIELVHAFSLVHDDLPAMDDDNMRRGQPTVHIAFDEATAILAGDALHTLAFAVLANANADVSPDIRIAMIAELANASGAAGMCGGQALDMAATGKTLSLAELEHLHSLKTGALIRAAVRMGALVAQASPETMSLLDGYAQALGLAFQIQDDILDVEGDAAALGKTSGKDAMQGKSTYPAILGLAQSQQHLERLHANMTSALATFNEQADVLRAIARYTMTRKH